MLVEIILVIYIMIALLLAYPLYFTEKGLNRPGLWFNVVVNSLTWPLFLGKFIYFLGQEFSSKQSGS